VWCSLALLCAVAVLARNPARPWAWLGEVALPLMALGGVLSSGLLHLVGARAHAPELTFALIQPSVPQQVKWDRDANRQAFAKVMDLSRAALALKPDVLVWPEAVTPGFLRYDDELRAAVTGLAREHKVWLILGADDATAKAGNPDEADYFNSAFLVSPEGRVLGKYDKQRLVIFGEYVPLARWLPFLKWFTPVEGGFTPGRQAVPFELGEPGLTLQVLICFEDVFAGHVRRCLDTDTQLLLNLTNNGWFGESAAQWQHAAMSVFRAVETGRPMVRCTNNGLTCWIDPAGRMHEVYFGDSKDIYGAGFKMARVPLYGRGTPLYSRWPQDWFGWLCVVVAGAWLLRRVMRRRRSPGRLEST
jgi:apolipoprotein N-acyltransferase